MKFISYAEMKLVPTGTVYYRYDDSRQTFLEGPFRKNYNSSYDIFYSHIGPTGYVGGVYQDYPDGFIAISDDGSREGLFEEEARYLILDDDDIHVMVEQLQGGTAAERILPGFPLRD